MKNFIEVYAETYYFDDKIQDYILISYGFGYRDIYGNISWYKGYYPLNNNLFYTKIVDLVNQVG